jgi:plasmid replication initiation protein
MNEVVKYDPKLNKLEFTGLSKTDLDVFMTILSRAKNTGDKDIIFAYKEIRKLAKLGKHITADELWNALEEMKTRLYNISCDILFVKTNGKRESHSFHVFDRWDNYEDEKVLVLTIAPSFQFLLNDFSRFEEFRLEEFVCLKSICSKNLYRILMEFSDVGSFTFRSVPQLKQALAIPNDTPNKKIKPVLEKCINEFFNKGLFDGISYELILDKEAQGKPIKAVRFTWRPIKKASRLAQ